MKTTKARGETLRTTQKTKKTATKGARTVENLCGSVMPQSRARNAGGGRDHPPLLQGVSTLADEWQSRIPNFEKHGCQEVAMTYRKLHEELQRELDAIMQQTLPLTEAARVSGFSADHLGRMIRQGRLGNVGRKYAPRVLLSELPIKPRPAGSQSLGEDIASIVESAIKEEV